MKNCKKCGNQFNDNYCPRCGTAVSVARIDRKYFTSQIQQILNFDGGFLYTVKGLLLKPGKVVKEYLYEDRNKLTKPVSFLIFTSILFAFTIYIFNIKYSYFNINAITILKDYASTGDFGEWLNSNIGYTNLILGCFFAFWIKIFYSKYNFNYYEIIVMLCYILGEATLLITFLMIATFISGWGILALFTILVLYFYVTWAIGNFYGGKGLTNYVKSALVIILGNISYIVFFAVIGFINKSLM